MSFSLTTAQFLAGSKDVEDVGFLVDAEDARNTERGAA
jgi:hypothetical protein